MKGATVSCWQALLVLLRNVTLGTLIALPNVGVAAEHAVQIVSDYENLRMVFEPKFLEIETGRPGHLD